MNGLFRLLLALCITVGTVFHFTNAFAQPVVPQLKCVTALPTNGVALTWQAGGLPANLCAGTGSAFSGFNIYVSTSPTGAGATLLTTVIDPLQTTYVDNTAPSATTLYYYLTTLCGGTESTPSAIVDNNPPVAPVMSKVTVIGGSTTQVSWQNSTSPEVYGYIIYNADNNGNFVPIDTILVTDAPTNTYLDLTAEADEQPEAYKIAAFDSCAIVPGPDNGVPHRTVYLDLQSNPCDKTISLDWTHYEGWGSALSGYEVAVGPTPTSTLSTVSTVASNLSAYFHTMAIGETEACFQIRAKNTDGSTVSESNIVCVTLTSSDGPDFMYMTNVSVTAANEVTVTWVMDTTDALTKINIRRGVEDSTDIIQLANYPIPGPLTSTMSYVDNTGETSRDVYVYQIQHIDSCQLSSFSTIAQTIRLEALDNFNLTNAVSWTPFYITHGTVLNYTLYRQTGSGFQVVATVNEGELLAYTDLVEALVNSGISGFCYYVEATYELNLPNGMTMTLTSRSNEACVNQSPRVYMPNAFLPNGINNVFKPVLLNPQAEEYSLVIQNRWGELVFVTNNLDEGWDGQVRGNMAPQGTYTYSLQLKTTEGYLIERKGTVTLIR